ncbi:ABC transporter permease [Legionella birminghamensis]|uniref:ABC transporter permease n=1 Tax=Legionella birminghamensis TaxID=28083 RepID=A0A378IA57_9GAMM|nr:ABC transporter permease [Legionella birminghamensis]STX31682.1 ABC transporter permease [Legionella birminghamensis]
MSKFFFHTGKKFFNLQRAITLFFIYLGHLSYIFIFKWQDVRWKHTILNTLHAGSVLVFPLIILSGLIGTSLAYSINYILAPFNLQNQALFIAQSTIIRDMAPLPIGFIFCVQCGLNLINPDHPSLNHTPDRVMLETILPLIVGVNITAMLLYTYISATFFLSVFLTFSYLLHMSTDEYVLRLSEIINPADVITSLVKTILYATIASYTAGYYYYYVTNKVMPVRKAVSRIITRGLFWLVVISVLVKLNFT